MHRATATEISARTGIKRPTVYVHVKSLIDAGLAERIIINNRTFFRACDPDVLSARLRDEQQKISALRMLYRETASLHGRPQVRFFEGEQQLVRLYEEIIGTNSVVAWFGSADSGPQFSETVYKLADYIREHKVTFRDIIPNTPAAVAYAKRIQRLMGQTYTYRTSREKMIANDILIFGNKVVLMRLHDKNLYAIAIEDPSFADTFRTIFDLSWKTLARGKN